MFYFSGAKKSFIKEFLGNLEITMGFYESSDDYSDPSGAYVMHIKPGFRSTKVKEVKQMDSNTCQDLFVLYQSGLSYVARKCKEIPHLEVQWKVPPIKYDRVILKFFKVFP